MPKEFVATSLFVPRSQFKMRPLADSLVRGKRVDVALSLLATSALKKALPLEKLLKSAVANATYHSKLVSSELIVKEVKIDQGPMQRYFKPGAQGRANMQRRRFSHMKIVLAPVNKEV
jgi:large subunit ribosomal protein L22